MEKEAGAYLFFKKNIGIFFEAARVLFEWTCGPQTCGCRGSGPTVRIGRVLHTSLSRVRHAHGGGFAGSEV